MNNVESGIENQRGKLAKVIMNSGISSARIAFTSGSNDVRAAMCRMSMVRSKTLE